MKLPWRRRRRDLDLDDEIRAHLDMAAHERMAHGERPEDAAHAAWREFGNVGQVKELTRQMWAGASLEQVLAELRHTLRQLARSPGFALAVIGTLALGIGVNTALFSLVNSIVLRPLPFPHSDRLVSVFEKNTSRGWPEAPVSVPTFQDWSTHSRQLLSLAALRGRTLTVNGEQVVGAVASAALFRMLGADPLIGRGFVDDEDQADGECVVALSRQFWTTRFGSEQAAIGKVLSVDDRACTVIGVLPDVDLPDVGSPSVWLPLGQGLERWRRLGVASNRGQRFLNIVGQLAPRTTLAQARAELSAVAARLAASYPSTNDGWGVAVVSLKDHVLGRSRVALLMLFGAVGLVLLIACANVANLLLARATMRRHEFAVRRALGAGRARLVRQMLAEHLTFSLLAGACGIPLAYWMIRLIRLYAPHALPRLASVRIDTLALVFTAAVSILTALVVGSAPFLSAVRAPSLHRLSQDDRADIAKSGARRVRDGLMASEIALAVILLTGSGLALESYWTLSHVELGFDVQHLLTARVTLPAALDPQHEVTLYQETIGAVASLPDVESVGATRNLPLTNSESITSFAIVGRASPVRPFEVSYTRVAGRYFHTMRIPLLQGRLFDDHDDVAGRTTVIANEAFVHLFFPDGRALGARLAIWGSDPPYEIVGIVGNTMQRRLRPTQQPLLYLPNAQHPERAPITTLVVRAADRDAGLHAAIRNAVIATAGPQSIANVASMDELMEASLMPHRYPALLLSVFAAFALLLACVGVYSVVGYGTAQRTREMGIRIALGALPTSVVALVMRQALWVIGAGAIVGMVVSLWLAKAMHSLVYDIAMSDPRVFIAVPCVLLCVAALAAYTPARQASRVDPLVALRNQ